MVNSPKKNQMKKMSFDKDGNILINGVPYSKYYSKEKPSDRLPKVNTSKSKGGDISKSILSNYQKIHKDYRLLNILNDDDKSVVAVYVPVNDNIRTYFIYFRDVSVEEKYSVIKMVYSLNSRAHKPFDVYDNYDNELDFSKMEIYLKEVGLSFGDFNNAWFYVEDDFINQGYK